MSSMYEMIFMATSYKKLALPFFGIDADRVGRFRDAWVEKVKGGYRLAVYTRNGGGNREDQDDAIRYMRNHNHYTGEQDDAFDNTYATFYFKVLKKNLVLDPDEERDEIWEAVKAAAVEPVDTAQRWRDAIAAIGSQETS